MKSEIKVFQRGNANWSCFHSFKKWIDNRSNCNNVADLTVLYNIPHMYSVSSWLSWSQKSRYFKEETKIELVFLSFKNLIKNLHNWNNTAYLSVWYYNLHMYSVSSWLSWIQKSSYFKEETKIELVFLSFKN